jgi:integrase
MEDVRPVSYTAPSRQILSLEKAKALLDETKVSEFWPDEITYTAAELAATTGVRLGECQALWIEDIHEGYITVAHSWDARHGLGSTKTKRVREIPLTTKTAKWLSRITAGRYEGFAFSTDGKRPIYYKIITKALYEALGKIGITERKPNRGLFYMSSAFPIRG